MPPIIVYGRWVALVAATALTAPGEQHLMVEVGTYPPLAWFAPLLLLIYTSAAFKSRNKLDVTLALLLMSATQSLAHLLASGLIQRSIVLMVVVSCLYSVILWRMETIYDVVVAMLTAALAGSSGGVPVGQTTRPVVPAPPVASVSAPKVDPAAVVVLPEAPEPPTAPLPEAPASASAAGTPGDGDPADEDAVEDPVRPELSAPEIVARALALRADRPTLTQVEAALAIGCSDRHLRDCLRTEKVTWGHRGNRAHRTRPARQPQPA
ncbi:hypothetical protein [Longispora fulva]|uniref:Uncharacterized protein n=1 Tax=Longispora fulva TaxID=619741 RepID=A0A8J7GNM3_9ACTN|nr:hypothetical protein [Longispora fulva]MBG6140467.1 hypothetical protein [Longispora fulva]